MDEKLVVLDESGLPTGKTVFRKEAHKRGILHGASHLFIYREKPNGSIDFLLQRRSLNKDSFPGCLDISSAGHRIEGMDFESTAIKELEEELGLKIKKTDLEFAFEQRISYKRFFHGKFFHDEEINKVYLLNCDVDISKLTLQKEEISEVVWMNSETISKKIEENDKEICLSSKEYNAVLDIVKQKLNRKNRLSHLKVSVEPVVSSCSGHIVKEYEKER